MKYSAIFCSCLLCVTFLQASPLSAGCGCGKKKELHAGNGKFIQDLLMGRGGCGCGGGGGKGSDEIPPDQE